MAFQREKKEQQEIAMERIRILFRLAGEEAKEGCDELAKSHVKLARSVGTRYNVRIPKEYKSVFCKGCSSYFTADSKKTRINSKEKKIQVNCVKCGRKTRKIYK